MNRLYQSNLSLPSGMPKQRLDHDFNSAWGSIICFDQLQSITAANPLWNEFLNNRLALEARYDEIFRLYTERFG